LEAVGKEAGIAFCAPFSFVIPAKAATQGLFLSPALEQRAMDSRLRGNDEKRFATISKRAMEQK
jgi:hypothetical protein